jgi:raffinose/stachyose/melibiose transport system substrate-binding protein
MKKSVFLVTAGLMALTMAVHGGGRSASDASGGRPREAELTIMMSIPQHIDQWEAYCRQFQDKVLAEKNIRLRINLEMPSSDQYDSVLQTRLTGGDAPDLYAVHSNNIGVYSAAGNLMDLSSQPLAAKIYANVRETVSVDGKLMAIPIESQAWGGLYNKDIFENCGLKPPDTLDELKRAVQVLEDNGYTPFLLAFQEQWVPQLMTALTLGGKVSGEIPGWIDRMGKNEGSYSEVREIFEVIRFIMDHGTSRAMEEGAEMGAADFANGKAAMFIQGTWASNTIMTTNPNMRLGVFPLPVNNNIKCTLINLSTSTTVGVYPGSKEPELALEFANYILDDNDSSALFQACGFNPVASCHDYAAASWVEDASRYVADGRAYQDLVLPASVTNEQGKLLQELYVGSVTVNDIIQRLDRAYQDANRLSR